MIPTISPSVAYLNGRFQLLEKTTVSVLDQGFLSGDGVFEVIPVYDGIPFQLSAHLKRLQRSLDALALANPMSELTWVRTVRDLIDQNNEGDQIVYVQVSRGRGDPDPVLSAGVTVFLMSRPVQTAELTRQCRGITLATAPDFRWQRPDLRTISRAADVLLWQLASQKEVDAILMTRENLITDLVGGNIFLVSSGEVLTPRLSGHVFAGVTRRAIIDLCRRYSIPVREAEITLNMARHAEELWVTSAERGVVPVVSLDGERVGDGVPGDVWKKVNLRFLELTGRVLREHKAEVRPAANSLSVSLEESL